MSEPISPALPDGETRLGPGTFPFVVGLAIVGAAALGVAVLVGGFGERYLRAYLASFAFWLSLSLGALFFVVLQHLTRSGWSVTVRRLAEALAANVLPLAVLFLPVIVGLATLYHHWAHPGDDPLLLGKKAWLNPTFFIIRAGVYFGIWALLSRWFLRQSVRQDDSGDPALTLKMQRMAPLGMVLFGVTVTLAAFDLLMSLDPHWFSTIFGVYYFSGALVGFFAILIVMAVVLQSSGRLTRSVTTEHYHDLGKQLFGYTVFWAYIAFSQYMLIWYANIPEETQWFLARQENGWGAVSLILVFGHFALPFLILMPRAVRRCPKALAGIAVFLLLMHWVDLYWLTFPGDGSAPAFGLPEILTFTGLGGLYLAAVVHRLSGAALLPARDPRLGESLAFENV